MAFVICVIGFYFQSISSRAEQPCSMQNFSGIDRTFPKYDSVESIRFTTPDGQPAEMRIYKRKGKTITLSNEFFTDEASLLVRYVPADSEGILVVGEIPDHPGTTFEFASCPNGSITPSKSPSSYFTDSEFREMAETVIQDFWKSPMIEPYREELLH